MKSLLNKEIKNTGETGKDSRKSNLSRRQSLKDYQMTEDCTAVCAACFCEAGFLRQSFYPLMWQFQSKQLQRSGFTVIYQSQFSCTYFIVQRCVNDAVPKLKLMCLSHAAVPKLTTWQSHPLYKWCIEVRKYARFDLSPACLLTTSIIFHVWHPEHILGDCTNCEL